MCLRKEERTMEKICVHELFDLARSLSAPLFAESTEPYRVLSGLADKIIELGKTLDPAQFDMPQENVWIAKSAKVAPTACIMPPCIIDENAEIRHCAFIRGSAIVGKGAVVGNSTEVKNAILFDGVQIPHFNYCGDSILGYKAHMAAGVITSNVKSDKTNVSIRTDEGRIETDLRKLGALVGDYVEIGCNTVLNPGTVIGRNTTVYPLSRVRGFIPAGHIYKSETEIVLKQVK